MSDRRLALEAIAYGDDPRITPGDRMRALEMLEAAQAAGEVSPAMARVLAHVESLLGQELDDELAGFMHGGWEPTEEDVMREQVERRFRAAVKRWAKRMGRDTMPRRPEPVREVAPDRPAAREQEQRELPAPAPEPVALTPVQASKMIREDVRTQIVRERRVAALPPGHRKQLTQTSGRPSTPEELWGDVPDMF